MDAEDNLDILEDLSINDKDEKDEKINIEETPNEYIKEQEKKALEDEITEFLKKGGKIN